MMSCSYGDVIAFGVQTFSTSPNRMTHRIRETVILITFKFSPSSWAPHQVGNTAALDLRRIFHRPERGNRANIGAKK
jgi:hypothetical protein